MAVGGSNNHPWMFAVLAFSLGAAGFCRAAEPLTWPLAEIRLAAANQSTDSNGRRFFSAR